jgi:transcription termination/antitermination protein NusA
MAQKNTELLSAIYQIADERGLDQDLVQQQVEKAFITAYRKMTKGEDDANQSPSYMALSPEEKAKIEEEENASLSVDIDNETGEIYVLADKKVVSVITDPNTQILESQAKLIDSRLREGDHIQIDVTPDNFGRIAAQAAYQRLMQGLRDAELETTMSKYIDKVGKIITGVIQRKDMNFVRVEVDRAEALMPISEVIPGEFYKSSERMRFLLVRLQNSVTDKRMVLSRGSGDFLKALFEVEVPEIATGSVEIMNIAREAGSRSKVAVQSLHDKVDAIGACVGPRGTRIDSIMNEVSPEKVDIILYDKTPRNYVINALSPAKVANVKINEEEQTALVLVVEDMLSLAIGKDGQNVRLAAKLTGYKIDITSDKSEFDDTNEEGTANQVESAESNEVINDTQEANSSENNEFNLENLGLTERQLKLLTAANISAKEDLEKVAKGEVEVEGFTKRDIAKLEQILA